MKKGTILLFLWILAYSCVAQQIKLQPLSALFIKPVDISSTGIEDDQRLFIVEKDGKIKIFHLSTNTLEPLPFLDIDIKVNSQANERGLLGMCFHPNYAANGYFFVNYTNNSGHTTISRFKRKTDNINVADENSEKILLVINQPFNNHNGGDLNFGPDGYLYIALGDGGNAGDPGNRSQNPKELLGKMLRIDINTESEKYIIPPTNPYFNRTDTLDEIWAFGLRNPWRFSFDMVKNELWIADVGQDKWEEINVVSADASAINYGWRCYEGKEKFNFSNCTESLKWTPPIHVYENRFDVGCSVTGGYVYRGTQFPKLIGKYIYTDFCTGIFWALSKLPTGVWINESLGDLDNMDYVTFGEDNKKELYVVGLASGLIFKVTDNTSSLDHDETSVNKITLSPNPVKDILKIDFIDVINDQKEWHIYDINGKKYNFFPITSFNGSIEINVDYLPSGTYFLKNHSEGLAQKFIKI